MPYDREPLPACTPGPEHRLTALRGSRHRVVDAHLHVVDFTQQSPDGPYLIDCMDRANVAEAVVFGLPVAKLWAEHDREPPDYYLASDSRCYYYGCTDHLVAEMLQSLPARDRCRLRPLLCGFNPTDRFAIRDVQRLWRSYPGMWCGIGELLLRHDDLTALTHGEPARANHPAMAAVYEFAADQGVPVLLHQNVTSVGKSGYPLYLHELEETLRDFPNTRIVLAHCGMSRRVSVPGYQPMIGRLLEQYPQLAVDYSWIVFDIAICPQGQLQPEWLALTERFSERICLGSDLVARFERLGPEWHRFDRLLNQLSDAARENVAFRTAQRLFASRSPQHQEQAAT